MPWGKMKFYCKSGMESYLEGTLPEAHELSLSGLYFITPYSCGVSICRGFSLPNAQDAERVWLMKSLEQYVSRAVKLLWNRLLWCHWYRSFWLIRNFAILCIRKNELAKVSITFFIILGFLQPKQKPLDLCKYSFLEEKYIVIFDCK